MMMMMMMIYFTVSTLFNVTASVQNLNDANISNI